MWIEEDFSAKNLYCTEGYTCKKESLDRMGLCIISHTQLDKTTACSLFIPLHEAGRLETLKCTALLRDRH